LQKIDIEIKGARTHNLKNISVNFPVGKWTTVTGVSGSGKSSLVFDTIFAESQRRFLETIGTYDNFYKVFPSPIATELKTSQQVLP
jgi:excinuclease UvrABC ATPase subunit